MKLSARVLEHSSASGHGSGPVCKIYAVVHPAAEPSSQACNAIGMIGMNHPNDGRNHPKDPCHWDEIIPMDGGWLPHWDEALDESTGIIEAVYFASYLFGGRSPPYN